MSQKNAKAERHQAEQDKPQFIVWERQYLNQHKREVCEHVVVAGTPPTGFIRFNGTGKVDIMSKAGMATAPLVFDIPGAENVAEAFELWEHGFKAAVEKVNTRIVLPGPGSGRRGGGG